MILVPHFSVVSEFILVAVSLTDVVGIRSDVIIPSLITVFGWIPDGQLCPTVPNRSNYVHWVEDLLASEIIPKTDTSRDFVRGFDIGTGANCIYPLLGASLLGWKFVASDVTDVAIEWAEKNVRNNPKISALIEIRKVEVATDAPSKGPSNETYDPKYEVSHSSEVEEESKSAALSALDRETVKRTCAGPPVLCGVVRDGETFDFCMCNPPFFESMDEAGLNPKTSCGGTPAEMVCPGGEKAFIIRIIEDSVQLKHTFRWYTSMVGRKTNLKSLSAKLREVGVTIVKTTEFVQGQTCRWGIAWSFVQPLRKIVTAQVASEKRNLSFMLEGLQRQISAMDVLKSIESFFLASGASCKLNVHSFSVDITVSSDHLNKIFKNKGIVEKASSSEHLHHSNEESDPLQCPSLYLSFCTSVFQQIPGTLLIKAALVQKESLVSGSFSSVIQCLEEVLKQKFSRERTS